MYLKICLFCAPLTLVLSYVHCSGYYSILMNRGYIMSLAMDNRLISYLLLDIFEC